jgi:hypothetical protein
LRWRAGSIAAVVLVCGAAIGVGERAEGPRTEPIAAVTPGGALLQVEVQPESGDLVPATAPVDAPAAAMATDGILVQRLADGSLHAELGDRFRCYAVTRRDADGNFEHACLEDPMAAGTFVSTAPAASAPAAPAPRWEVK